MKSWHIACIVSTMLVGCATQYQDIGVFGGIKNRPGPGKMEYVYFAGNAYVAPKTAQDYTLYRCAEIARDRNSPYFVIYDSLVAAALDRPDNMPRVGIVAGMPVASTLVLPLSEPQNGAKETAIVLRALGNAVHPQNSEAK